MRADGLTKYSFKWPSRNELQEWCAGICWFQFHHQFETRRRVKAELATPVPSVAIQLRNSTVNGFRSAFESLLGIFLFLAESGPTVLLWLMILAFPAWLLWRRYRRSLAMGLSL